MTPTRYWIARLGRALGFNLQTQRLSELATESHLLRDAETVLGAAVWEKTEHLEELSIEYWNLRKIQKKRAAIEARMNDYREQMARAHDERTQALQTVLEPEQKLIDEKADLVEILEELSLKRDRIINEAREIRRTYDGLKTKLEFLEESHDAHLDEITKVKARLIELKTRFTGLKSEREKIRHSIERGEERLDKISAELAAENLGRRTGASEAFQAIGDANREYTALRAELRAMDSNIQQFHSEIGRHLSRNAATDPACAKIVSSHRSLVRIMDALRHSIQLNRELTEV